MKKFTMSKFLVLLTVFIFMLTACAKKSDKTAYYSEATSTTNSTSDMRVQKQDMQEETGTSEASDSVKVTFKSNTKSAGVAPEGTELTSKSAVNFEDSAKGIQDKIIRNVNMQVETKKFDGLLQTINAQIKQLGGYVENSQISGQSYNDSNENRNATITARIPKSSLDEFVNKVSDNSNVISKEENTENVTLDYIDIESRKKALTVEQDRLYAILEKATKLDNVITLENRLSEIRYELQKYESQLRTYDNQVEYSTVTMEITEVERITPVSPKKKTVGDRIRIGFGNSVFQLSEGFKNFFVWFVVNIPYLILWAVFIFIIVIITRKIYLKNNPDSFNTKKDKSTSNLGQNDTKATEDKENK